MIKNSKKAQLAMANRFITLQCLIYIQSLSRNPVKSSPLLSLRKQSNSISYFFSSCNNRKFKFNRRALALLFLEQHFGFLNTKYPKNQNKLQSQNLKLWRVFSAVCFFVNQSDLSHWLDFNRIHFKQFNWWLDQQFNFNHIFWQIF